MAAPVPIYVIALEHTHARRKAISERLGAHGLSFNFIKAVNGKNLAEDEIDNFTTFTRQKYLTLAENPLRAILGAIKDLDDIAILSLRIDIVNLHFRDRRK